MMSVGAAGNHSVYNTAISTVAYCLAGATLYPCSGGNPLSSGQVGVYTEISGNSVLLKGTSAGGATPSVMIFVK